MRLTREKANPLPIHVILDSPLVATMDSAAFGALVHIIFCYWQSECADSFPSDDNSLAGFARAGLKTWRGQGASIRQAFAELKPRLKLAHDKRQEHIQKLEMFLDSLHAKRRAAGLHTTRPEQAAPPIVKRSSESKAREVEKLSSGWRPPARPENRNANRRASFVD